MKFAYLISSDMMVEGFKRVAAFSLLTLFLPVAVAVAEPLEGTNVTEAFSSEIALAASADPPKEGRVMLVDMTAYTSREAETDSTPCIAAGGFDLCENNREDVVAANFVPLGTRIKVPSIFGDKTFTVVDRMNSRYTNRVDFWFKDLDRARQFGVRTAEIIVLPN
ncbi:MAG: hypothetical protein R3B52_02935 [Candidatus Paceibacterota bacterium]